LKKCFRDGFHIFATHMKEASKDKVASIEYHPLLKNLEDIFGEIAGFPPNTRDSDFSIDLVSGVAPVSKTPYRMGTPELKELQM
jgi:hypothetical protein